MVYVLVYISVPLDWLLTCREENTRIIMFQRYSSILILIHSCTASNIFNAVLDVSTKNTIRLLILNMVEAVKKYIGSGLTESIWP